MIDRIPAEKRAAVAKALAAAFGPAELEDVARLSGGLSGASVFRIRVAGSDYLLRLDTPANAFGDAARAYACLAIAANAGISPALRYADAADRITIVDFVQAQPLGGRPPTGPPLPVDLAQALARLHRAPAFPPLVDYLEGMQALIARHRESRLLDASVTQGVLDRYVGLAAVYRTRPEDLVSSHNDLNPGNILYDGERLWFVDWEAAFLADRYVDLATLANWFAFDPQVQTMLVTSYFGAAPTPEQSARLHLMRLVNHIFYGMIMLNGAADERPEARLADGDLSGLTLADIGPLLRQGRFDMTAWENRIAYGKARLAAADAGMQGPAFEAALALVA
jgi:aminoglycoside phosphotransferase (APT) family kinase protein